jgi:3-phenylpropionate/trans-cinnamate dioxygenase ferredoxin reductase subunit
VTVAIVGAGLAGLRTVEGLRQEGYAGRIVLVGAETHPPYSRPPLSKEVLRGDADADAATLRSSAELAALDVELRLGTTATALSVENRTLTLSDGSVLQFDDAVIATGATPRALPGVQLRGVHVLRTVDDCLALREAMRPDAHVVIVGAGFIGLEVAASARARGCAVTIVDVLPAPLARVLDVSLGGVVTRLHETNGVDVRCGVGVAAVEGRDTVEQVALADGSVLPADVVVVGIGVVPATQWLAESALTIDDGVVCDEALSAAPGVWAVGDVARWQPPGSTRTIRLEHWTNATEQPQCVARSIAHGEAQAFGTVPYFWSDQYDAKLQSLGSETLGDELRIVWGALDEPKWVGLVRSGDRLGAIVGMRAPGRVMKLRPLLASRASWSDALAAATSS